MFWFTFVVFDVSVFAFLIMIMVDEQQRFWISFGFWRATSERPGASSGPLRGVLGRLGSVLGASWDRLGTSWEAKPSWSRLGAVLEPSWKRLGGVLGTSWAVLEASWGRLVGLFEVSWAVLWPFWGVWGRLGGILWLIFFRIPFFN